jgi:hypothetical protein
MARTIQQIYDVIEQEKNSKPELASLNSPSQTAVYKVWMWVIAACQWILEVLWDKQVEFMLALIANSVVGSLFWYRKKALEFQWNPSVSYYINFDENGIPIYNELVIADRIVKYAAAVDSFNGLVVVKAAKDLNGTPVPLDASELLSFKDYMLSIKFAGTKLQCISFSPDLIRAFMKVYYDPISNLAVVKQNVENAANQYLKNLPFNGIFYIERLQDAIQKVEGVVSVEMVNVEANLGTTTIYPINRYYRTVAGYAVFDPNNGLDSTVTYIASNV